MKVCCCECEKSALRNCIIIWCVRAHTHTHACTHTHARTHVRTSTHILYVCTYAHVRTYSPVHGRMCTYIHTYVLKAVHACTYTTLNTLLSTTALSTQSSMAAYFSLPVHLAIAACPPSEQAECFYGRRTIPAT